MAPSNLNTVKGMVIMANQSNVRYNTISAALNIIDPEGAFVPGTVEHNCENLEGSPIKGLVKRKNTSPGQNDVTFLLYDTLTGALCCFVSHPISSWSSVAERDIDPHQSPMRIKAYVL